MSATKGSTSFKEISKQLNLNNIRLFNNTTEGLIVVIIPYLNSSDKSFALKGTFLKGTFIIDNEIFVEKIKSENQTQTFISKDNEYFLINTVNNNDVFQNIDLGSQKINMIDFRSQLKGNSTVNLNFKKVGVVDDQYGNHGGNGFCQRERNETFSECYKAEKDEFCDDFFSCIAADVVPAVSILIAASCSCAASQSD